MAIKPNYFFQEHLVFIIFGLVLPMFVVFSLFLFLLMLFFYCFVLHLCSLRCLYFQWHHQMLLTL
jgi:hypothetical protein